MLGTPPAFILSQDRTLTFKSLILFRTKAWLLFCPLLLWFVTFLNYSLGIFQGCITVYLSRCFVVALDCRNSFRISRCGIFVNNFLKFFWNFFGNGLFPRFRAPFKRAKVIIAKPNLKCNTFFWKFLLILFTTKCCTLKSGFFLFIVVCQNHLQIDLPKRNDNLLKTETKKEVHSGLPFPC